MIDLKIEETIATSVRGSIEAYLQSTDINAVIADTLQKQVSNVIMNLTSKIFNDIVGKRDLQSEVTALVNNILADQLIAIGKNQIAEIISNNDITKLILSSVQNEVHKVAGSYNFPEASIPYNSINMANAVISASQIDSGIIKTLNSSGLSDQASQTQLIITDEGIITTNNVTAENLLIEDNTFLNNLTIDGELSFAGSIGNISPLDNHITNISNSVASNIFNSTNIDLTNRNIVYGDRLILNNDTLGPQIINSNLRNVGNLNELVVSGQAIIHETLVVTNRQVGINTESASGVLSVWDEDAEFTLVKHSPKTMFAGSTRITDVILGSNNQEQVKLKTDGTIELNGPIRFEGLLINIVDRIPERIGEPGEIAILRDGSAIYRCQGQNSWGRIL